MSALPAHADLKIGVLISLTGYGAALGAPARNTVELLPTTHGGQKVEYIVADDTSDTTVAVRQARRFVEELHVDAIIGTSITPTSLAVLPVVGASRTPLISLSGSGTIIGPQAGDKRWAFKLAPNESTMGERIFADIRSRKFKTHAFVAFANAYGESFVR
jgi:branched-chain amino acid transport system substrate-binding protein